ncbi:hypothetical protein F5B20DRAFT_576126 [Whalleya microplaca]|nr:hypothetical protein F5B20DRAFT_576126 [Whalleya microplaca]
MESSQIVSIVALIVSITALAWSTLQLIHAYLSSAQGYSKINKKVMPGWDKFKNRVFLWDQFRFQVNFETPVLVVCRASNTDFPVRDASDKSEPHVLIGSDEHIDLIPAALVHNHAIHTVDNELATWITLLSAIHRMETESSMWQTGQLNRNPPSASPPPFAERSLVVAIQRKKRSWDNMPSSITRPYATTTICHIIEIAAMLGLHWKQFDRSKDTFLAEGNGFVLKATSVTELGTVFTFQRYGKSKFEEGRIIPAEHVKGLAFGFVSTIYRDAEAGGRLELPAGEAIGLTTLQLGTTEEFAETLVSFGCNTETSKCIRDNNKRHGHLFPLAFELLGMLGKIFHVKNSFFRVIPNPTFYHWNRQYFNLHELLLAYKKTIDSLDYNQQAYKHLNRLQNRAENVINETCQIEPIYSAALLNALHQALEVCDKFLTVKVPRNKPSECSTSALEPAFASLDAQPPESRQDKLIEIYFTKVLPKVNGAEPNSPPLTSGSEIDTNIWCTWVFRSLCWLTLHDFHKNDKQIASKIELMGNRLPVYVI